MDRLRQLPLTPEARLQLLQELVAACSAESPDRLPLVGELAELCSQGCEASLQREAWADALHHFDLLQVAVEELATAVPERAEAFWSRSGDLLASLTAAVHPLVVLSCAEPPPLMQRAELAWALCRQLQRASESPMAWPDWLPVLEQQLVQDGAQHWQTLAAEGGLKGNEARARTLAMLERLTGLVDPVPEWLRQQRRELIEAELLPLLEGDALHDPEVAAALIARMERFAVPPEVQEAYSTALLRARLALELLHPPETGASATAAAPRVAQPAMAAEPGLAELVWLPSETEATPLQFDLRPVLEAEAFSLDDALDDFVWHLPRGSSAEPGAAGLQRVLEQQWQQGLRLDPPAFERLAELAVAWQRRLGNRIEALPPLDWTDGLVVELGTTELAVVAAVLRDASALTPALAQMRREHQNAAFWQQRQEIPWMVCLPPLEALRRLHVEEGFYVSGHQPLAEVEAWGQEVTRALLEAALWTDDAGCLGVWLAVGQELVARGLGPLPPLGLPPTADEVLVSFGGQEVVYLGDQAMAVGEAHRAGRCFRGAPFGLRVVEMPSSRWPKRPAGSFSETLAVMLEALDGLYRERPFGVFMADCGAYRLPLLRAVHQRYGIPALSSGRPMATWLKG
ncbi:MAG: hypothetical protein WCF98_02095 [Synechococcus sp. ELA057]